MPFPRTSCRRNVRLSRVSRLRTPVSRTIRKEGPSPARATVSARPARDRPAASGGMRLARCVGAGGDAVRDAVEGRARPLSCEKDSASGDVGRARQSPASGHLVLARRSLVRTLADGGGPPGMVPGVPASPGSASSADVGVGVCRFPHGPFRAPRWRPAARQGAALPGANCDARPHTDDCRGARRSAATLG